MEKFSDDNVHVWKQTIVFILYLRDLDHYIEYNALMITPLILARGSMVTVKAVQLLIYLCLMNTWNM